MFHFKPTSLSGVLEIKLPFHQDERGSFSKVFQNSLWAKESINFHLKETYFSRSAKNVIRGMHFQLPPFQHHKIVYCPYGAILDVVLDLRTESPSFGSCCSTLLSEENNNALFIPEGCAHGLKSLRDDSYTVYLVSSEYHKVSDAGVLWNSFGFDWQCEDPVISTRDQAFSPLPLFKSPF